MARAELVGSKLIVFNVDDARKIFAEGFFGKPLGVKKPKGTDISSPLELSLIEGMYLLERGIITVGFRGKTLGISEFAEIAKKKIEEFTNLYIVYKELRDAGFIVRSGLKYGSDFAVYRLRPGLEHAPYLVKVILFNKEIDPGDLVGWGRLSHSVRKKLILAIIYPGKEVNYIMFKWFKP